MTEVAETEERRKARTIPGIGLPAGTDYPNLSEIPSIQCTDVYWRKEVSNSFEIANNGYSFYRIPDTNSIFAKDLSGYWYKLNNETRCFEFMFEGFKDTTDYTRINLPPQAPTFVGFNFLHQAVFPMNDDGKPILPKDDRGKTIFPFYDGYPLFPVDDSGAICVPLGDDGKPVFPRIYEEYGAYVPCDVTGRVVLPLNEKAEPIYPRDEEGNVLMPFVISEDGTRKRAVYVDDEGTPILPFHNGEHALEVHEGEVLFQYEYQQKMMILAQYPSQKSAQSTQLMDEQFYQQHAAQYQNQMDMTSSEPSEFSISKKPAEIPTAQKSPAANLLLKQLSFMKKKQETPTGGVNSGEKTTIPVERPPKLNKEKERPERFIPEPLRRNRPSFRDDRNSDRVDRSSPSNRNSRRDDYRNPPRNSSRDDKESRRRQRSRTRSLTWSPEDRKRKDESRDKRAKRKRETSNEETQRRRRKHSKKERKERKRDRSSSRSSRSSSNDSDYDRHEKRHRKSEKSRK